MEELIQEGNMGLMHAVPRFDPSRELRFTTFATWWIRHKIARVVQHHGSTVRVSVWFQEAERLWNQARRQLLTELGRDPTATELAARLEWSAKQLAKFEKTRDLVVHRRGTSLDAPMAEHEDGYGEAAIDALADPARAPAVEDLIEHETRERVKAAIARLPAREADVVRRRFGMHGGDAERLREVGAAWSLTRQRVRQIERIAFEKLRRLLAREHRDRIAAAARAPGSPPTRIPPPLP